jgi:5-carboxymethyl-2-hydroxymuconate isomerase
MCASLLVGRYRSRGRVAYRATIRVAKGRPAETRRRIAETVFADARKHLDSVYATSPFVLSVEVQEIDPDFRIHESNIRAWMKAKEPAA